MTSRCENSKQRRLCTARALNWNAPLEGAYEGFSNGCFCSGNDGNSCFPFGVCSKSAFVSVKAEAQSVKAEPPAKLEGRAVKEADLSTIVLTMEAENRIGIRLEEAKVRAGSEARRFSG